MLKYIKILPIFFITLSFGCSTLEGLLGRGKSNWKDATPRIEAAMITPLLVLNDENAVKRQAKQIADSPNFNSIVSLVDLQVKQSMLLARDYIFAGRNATSLDSKTKKNIEIVLDQGVTPILIVRNDWAARTRTDYIPSIGGQVGNDAFYSDSILQTEKQFLSSLSEYYKYIHIQLNIEPSSRRSALFAVRMAEHLRNSGFKNKILINPAYDAINEHAKYINQLNALNVTWARSRNGSNFGGDPIINTDGNGSINQYTFKDWLNKIKATGREYIIWSGELANSAQSIPNGYL